MKHIYETYIFVYIQRTNEENTTNLVLRVSSYQSSAKKIHNGKVSAMFNDVIGLIYDAIICIHIYKDICIYTYIHTTCDCSIK